jgi:hypothetical protein
MTETRKFPWWIIAGAAILAAGYLPTLTTPFDFIDDGNLVYPSPRPTLAAHAGLWWEKVAANYEHLGPFRPTLWVHWQLQANLLDGDAFKWRLYRLVWCGLAAGMLLWLFRELGLHPVGALLAGALAMWNPYRNEIWTSLTLAEGVAMPYALFALVAARKAAQSERPLKWEVASAAAVLVALGCKNTFAAIVPPQVVLRMWPDGVSLREAWRRNGWRSLALAATLVLPVAHFAYFKAHWHPGQYETHGPSAAQFGRMLSGLKGAVSLDFMAAGLVLAAVAVWVGRKNLTPRPPSLRGNGENEGDAFSPPRSGEGPGEGLHPAYRAAFLCAGLLVAGGLFVYLPMSMMSGRYSMPAVWGLDILVAVLLTALVAVPESAWRKVAWAGVCGGLAAVMVANVGRQEKFAARARLLWDAVRHVEATAPPDARIAWVSGDSLKGELNVEEGIHFQWHLYHRGRGDVRVGLFDADGKPLDRVELPPLAGEPDFRLCGVTAIDPAGLWDAERSFAAAYWLGRRKYDCHLSRRHPPALHADNTHQEEAAKLFRAMLPPPPPPLPPNPNDPFPQFGWGGVGVFEGP